MAAKLKKRALAEFSHVIKEEPKPVKRLRLMPMPTKSELHLNLQSNSTPQEILHALVVLERSFPIEQVTAERLFPELMEQFNGSRDSLVRSKILNMFKQLALVPGFNPQVISDQLLPMLQTEESHKVKSAILSVLITIGCCLPNSLSFHHQLVTQVQQLLANSSHLVRSRCLELIGELGASDEKMKEVSAGGSTLQVLGQYASDYDPRVRTAAFTAMLRLYERGQALSQSVYSQACAGLEDDNEDVRRRATKLIWVLSRLYPESMVNCSAEGGEDLRLVDDGFTKICNRMNDISLNVRVQSAALLGSMHQVGGRFLEQTLDKKLMSNMRRKVSAHERAKEHFESGEWSSGARWADDNPRESMDAESVSLMNIGACGAFVHGLEDEFLEVRNAALDSLCELAVQSPRFAVLSQDSIIDMVNDEIESVRLNAINSLYKLSKHLTLRDDQLEIVLGVLQDFSFSTREALRALLGEIRMVTRESIRSTIFALLDNIPRYPEDTNSIYVCCHKIGQHHPHLMMILAEELMCIHPYFDSKEISVDDPKYVAALLAVFNAAALNATMTSLFPEHIRRHYTYLRCSLPHLVPSIQVLDNAERQVGEKVVSMATNSTEQFLQQLLNTLSGLTSFDLDTAEEMLKLCVRDLERVEELDSKMSATSECMRLYLSSQLILTELIKSTMKLSTDKVYQENVTAAVDKIFQQTTKLHTLFLGMGGELTALVRQTEIKTLAVQLLFILERSSLTEKIRCLQTFQQYLMLVKHLVESDPTYDDFTRQVVSLSERTSSSEFHLLPKTLRNLSQLLRPVTLAMPSDVRKIMAEIEEPPPTTDKVLKFPAGMGVTINLVANFRNLEDTNAVSVLVRYPDQLQQYVTPPLNSWKRFGPLNHRLVTPIMLAHGLWSEACYVEVSLVVEAQGEGRQLLKLPEKGSLRQMRKMAEKVPLTKPVKVLVFPKPPGR